MNAGAGFPTLLDDLLSKVLDGALDDGEQAALDEILQRDPQARQCYHEHIALHALLHWQEIEASSDVPNAADSLEPPIQFDPWIESGDASWSFRSTFASGLFSYTVAAVLLAIFLLAGWAWRISLPVVGDSGPRSPDIAQTIGRITALADCQWQKTGAGVRGSGSGFSEIQIPKSPNPQIPVFLGDRFLLASGLMEITYDSGAVVILEGPCTYEIDSSRGGYLAVGKLTAKVEKGSGARGPGCGNANHSPLSPLPSPLFAVRTPTAIVTDLGTEFGVEVEQSGATRSHVFQGSVEVCLSKKLEQKSSPEPVEILHAGESVRVERGRNMKVIIIRDSGQPGRFVRRISKPQNPQISNSTNPQSLIPNPSYRLTDLGTLGGARSTASYLNARGQVVGWADISTGVTHAFLYDNGVMKDLGVLAGNDSSGALGINAKGVVVGDVGRGDKRRGFMYINGKMHTLPSLGGNDTIAKAVNDGGTVVGVSRNAAGIERAFIYTQTAGIKDLGALGGPQARSLANHINPAGMVVGASETSQGPTKAFLYTPDAGMKALGDFGGDRGEGYKINNAGQIVGYATDRKGRRQAFFYDEHKGMKKLADSKCDESVAMDINNASEIVGFYSNVNIKGVPSHAFICRHGEITDLNSLIDPTDGWTLVIAMAINDAGQIVGIGQSSFGDMRAYLLTPVREGSGARAERQGIH